MELSFKPELEGVDFRISSAHMQVVGAAGIDCIPNQMHVTGPAVLAA